MLVDRITSVRRAAEPFWRQILESQGASDQSLDGKHRPCPACGGRDRFRYDGEQKGSGSHFCNGCGAGDGFKLLMKMNGITFINALHFVEDWLSNKSSSIRCSTPPTPDQVLTQVNSRARHNMESLWRAGRDITPGDAASVYLARRGIQLSDAYSLRFHPSVWTQNGHGEVVSLPALLAAFRGRTGELVQVQRTFLPPDGHDQLGSFKKMMPRWNVGVMRGGAVRLFDAGQVLGIAEGFETALSAHCIFGVPVWAALSASMLEHFEPPDIVKRLIVFCDNDTNGVGQFAGEKLRERLRSEDLEIQILIPTETNTDFNDILRLKMRKTAWQGDFTRDFKEIQ